MKTRTGHHHMDIKILFSKCFLKKPYHSKIARNGSKIKHAFSSVFFKVHHVIIAWQRQDGEREKVLLSLSTRQNKVIPQSLLFSQDTSCLCPPLEAREAQHRAEHGVSFLMRSAVHGQSVVLCGPQVNNKDKQYWGSKGQKP